MKKPLVLVPAALLLAITVGCSEQSTPKTDSDEQAQAPAESTLMGPAPKLPASHNLPQDAAKAPPTMAHPMPSMASDMPTQGTVLEMMHAAGYTYMKLDTGADKPIWIAATMMRVQPKDKVQWADAAVMRNFASKSLHRTFDEILFVSSASIIN